MGRVFVVIILAGIVLTSVSFSSSGWVAGKTGNALAFDGTDDYVKVPGYYGIGGTNARTVSLWIKTSTTGKTQTLVQWGANSTGQLWMIYILSTNVIQVAAYGGGIHSTATVTDGAWHHIAVVLDEGQIDSGQIRLYIDGVLDTIALTSSCTINTAQTEPVQLGTWYSSSTRTRSNYFSGLMDDVCIYDRALDASEIVPENPIPTEGLVAHWAMDETEGIITHDSVSSHDGIISFPYSGGTGTAENPYRIATKGDLLTLAATTAHYSKYFILTADINLMGETFTTAIIAPDTKVSDTFEGTKFTGKFDGNGHIISNLNINTTSGYYISLFGYVGSYGQICNLGLENVDMTGYRYIGGLCGYNYGTISQCYATGTVMGSIDIGGLCGTNTGTILQSYATGEANGSEVVGGLCGHNRCGALSQCCATSVVTGSGYAVGGLCGLNSSGMISQCYATGVVAGNDYGVGGLCGTNIIGTILQSYAAGTVIGSSFFGGLCGYNGDGFISDCLWDTDISGLTVGYNQDTVDPGIINNVVGKTTVEMQTVSTFTDIGWDCSNADGDAADWILSGIEYPHLVSETTAVVPDIIGMMQQDARAALAAANIQIVNIYTASDPIPVGQVISQSLAAGTEILCGTTITLTVSGGAKYAGSGTEVDPYQITSKYELLTFAATPADYGSYFILTADIDLASETFAAAVIAPTTTVNNTAFTGKFNGNGHVISNLNIYTTNNLIGLFGCVGSGGQIINLGLENVNITGKSHVGGLCGGNDFGAYVSQCYVIGTVMGGGDNVSGLCGCNWGTLSQSYAIGTVMNGGMYVGGLCGSNLGTLSQCYAISVVTGSSYYVGGLCGYTIGGCISQCYATGTVTGITYVGGLCGYTIGGCISQCYATGAVTGSSAVGGLCGKNSGTINQSYATGTVTGSNDYIGSLCGYHYGSSARIENSFWNTEVSGLSTGYNLDSSNPGMVTNVLGKTTAEMMTLSTFTDARWDFTNETANGTSDIWRMRCEGMNYPKLSWQDIPAGDFACPDGVNTEDLEYFVGQWLLDNCTTDNNYCGGVDMDISGAVDMADIAIFAGHWLEGI